SVPGDQLLLFDDGTGSVFQQPPGETRNYSAPRKYQLDLGARTATEIWHYYAIRVFIARSAAVFTKTRQTITSSIIRRLALISILVSLLSTPRVTLPLTANMSYWVFVPPLGTRSRSIGRT